MSDIDVRAELAHWIENVQDADLAAEIASVVTGNDVAGETPEDIPNSATIGQPVPQ